MRKPFENIWKQSGSHLNAYGTIWKPKKLDKNFWNHIQPYENHVKTYENHMKTIRKHMKTIWKPLLADARCCLQKQGRPRHSNEKNGASRSLSSQVSVGAQKHCKKQYKINILLPTFLTCSRCLKIGQHTPTYANIDPKMLTKCFQVAPKMPRDSSKMPNS